MTYEDCLKLTADKWNSLDVDTKVEILNTLEAHEAEVDARNYASQRYQEILSERDKLSQLHTETKQNDVCFSQILQTPDTTSNPATPLSNETDLDEAKSSFIEQMESTDNLSYETDHEDISYIDSYDDSYEDSASESITI